MLFSRFRLTCFYLAFARALALLLARNADVDEEGDLGNAEFVTIVSTAAVPWNTGVAVNSVLRAVSLANLGKQVNLVLPWLTDRSHQQHLYGMVFDSQEHQAAWIYKWCKMYKRQPDQRLELQFSWYNATYFLDGAIHADGSFASSFARGFQRDVLILEDPLFALYFQAKFGSSLRSMFKHVIGIEHTNYNAYLRGTCNGIFGNVFEIKHAGNMFGVRHASILEGGMCDMHLANPISWEDYIPSFNGSVCELPLKFQPISFESLDVVIRLSDVFTSPVGPVGTHATRIANVNGVSDVYLRIGDSINGNKFLRQAYFVGKAIWAKGWNELFDLLEQLSVYTEAEVVHIHAYGSGDDEEAISKRSQLLPKLVTYHKGKTHDSPEFENYPILVNPSTSDVLSTVTMEALAMGKRCVLAHHPSNIWFQQHFPDRVFLFEPGNIVSFRTAYWSANVLLPPRPLSQVQRTKLTWGAATDRLLIATRRDWIRRPPNKALEDEGRALSLWLTTLYRCVVPGYA